MSRADDHAQDLAQYMFFDDTLTDFSGYANLQEILEDLTNKTNGSHFGNTSINFATLLAGMTVDDGILRVLPAASLNVDGLSFFTGNVDITGDTEIGNVNVNGALNTFGDVDFNTSILDFSSATIVGFPETTAVLPDWQQAYRFTGAPTSALGTVSIPRATLEGKEIIVTLYDPNNVDETTTIISYFPNIGASMPSDHITHLGLIRDDGNNVPIEYQSGSVRGNGTKILLVLYRDPVIFPVGGISFDINSAVQWSNTI